MKLEKWALIAEIVGSFAVVVTLIILIVEVRGNTEELRAATLSDLAGRTQEMQLLPTRHPQYADVIARMLAGDELTAAEIIQSESSLVATLKLTEESFIAYRDGRLDEVIWLSRGAVALNLLGTDLNKELYPALRDRGSLVPAFTDWLDAALVERYGQ